MTCKDCDEWRYCFDRSREYPCKDFKPVPTATTKPNKAGEKINTSNYTGKKEASKNGTQSVTEGE